MAKRIKRSDDLYSEVELVTVNAICPAELVEQARDIAIEYIKETQPGNPDTRGDMLPTRLSKTGQDPTTHYLCSITTTDEEATAMAARLIRERNKGKDWCHNAKLSKNANKKTVEESFVIIVCEKQELLDKLGLKEIK